MAKIAITTDSNSGITQKEAKELGVYVLPMPFIISDETYFEDINLTQEQFYEMLEGDESISTTQPSPEQVMKLWDDALMENDYIIHIPMSSGLSGSCGTATMLSREDEYEGKVFVVDNQRISVTQRQSVIDALNMAKAGKEPQEIYDVLMETKMESSIYIMVDTLKYLKRGGRITAAAAALGTILKLKPVLQIQGEKLDAFAKCRTLKAAKTTMLDAIAKDLKERFQMEEHPEDTWIAVAYTKDLEAAEEWKAEVQKLYPKNDIVMNPLSLSVSCHIGPGAIAVTCTKKLPKEI